MALIKCEECGKEISDTAKSCPNCGFVLSKKKQNNNDGGEVSSSAKWISLFIPIIGFVLYIINIGSNRKLARVCIVHSFLGVVCYFALWALIMIIKVIINGRA